MLIGGMIDDQLGDHLQPAPVRLADQIAEILPRAESGMDVAVIGDIVAVVAHRRRIERQQPYRVDAQVLEIGKLFGQAAEIPDAVVVAVAEGLDVQLVDDRVLVPQWIVAPSG